jgi:hypothetical protein
LQYVDQLFSLINPNIIIQFWSSAKSSPNVGF